MQARTSAAQGAIKNEQPFTLAQAVALLQKEYASVQQALGQLPADQWLDHPGRLLCNREQELYTTLQVLRGFAMKKGETT